MKIEKLSESQIRFTLWPSDLEDEDLQLSDFSTDKTGKVDRMLHHMMDRAREEFGFDVNGSSIIVEATQVDNECVVFLITKIDGDTKVDSKYEYIRRLKEAIQNNAELLRDRFSDVVIDRTADNKDSAETDGGIQTQNTQAAKPKPKLPPEYLIYTFDDLDPVIKSAKMVSVFYDSDNSLYKDKDGLYYLIATRNRNSVEEFNIAIRCFREFGKLLVVNYGTRYYIEEHYKCIIKDEALQTLGEMRI